MFPPVLYCISPSTLPDEIVLSLKNMIADDASFVVTLMPCLFTFCDITLFVDVCEENTLRIFAILPHISTVAFGLFVLIPYFLLAVYK